MRREDRRRGGFAFCCFLIGAILILILVPTLSIVTTVVSPPPPPPPPCVGPNITLNNATPGVGRTNDYVGYGNNRFVTINIRSLTNVLYLRSLNVTNSALIWEIQIPCTYTNVFDNIIYLSVLDGAIYASYVCNYDVYLARFDGTNGAVVWQGIQPFVIGDQMVVVGNALYVFDTFSVVHKFDASTGTLLWDATLPCGVFSRMVYDGSKLIGLTNCGGFNGVGAVTPSGVASTLFIDSRSTDIVTFGVVGDGTNVYVQGYAANGYVLPGQMDWPSANDGIVIKYTQSGTVVWNTQFGDLNPNFNFDSFNNDIRKSMVPGLYFVRQVEDGFAESFKITLFHFDASTGVELNRTIPFDGYTKSYVGYVMPDPPNGRFFMYETSRFNQQHVSTICIQ